MLARDHVSADPRSRHLADRALLLLQNEASAPKEAFTKKTAFAKVGQPAQGVLVRSDNLLLQLLLDVDGMSFTRAHRYTLIRTNCAQSKFCCKLACPLLTSNTTAKT